MNRAVICKVSELQPFDRITSGTLLGPFEATEMLTVKTISPADNNKFAVTFFNIGTIFLHEGALVEVIPSVQRSDDEDDD